MAKLKQVDGKSYRQRRAKWVEIPMEWVGRVFSRKERHPYEPNERIRRATETLAVEDLREEVQNHEDIESHDPVPSLQGTET